jgi:hypothetical protein
MAWEAQRPRHRQQAKQRLPSSARPENCAKINQLTHAHRVLALHRLFLVRSFSASRCRPATQITLAAPAYTLAHHWRAELAECGKGIRSIR